MFKLLITNFVLLVLTACLLCGCSSHNSSPEDAGLLPDPAIEYTLLRAAPDYTADLVKIGGIPARYVYRRIDLDQDGQNEVVVYLLGPFFCGTGGCNLLILKEHEGEYKVMNNFPTTQLPLLATRDTMTMWSDLYLLESGGGAKSRFIKYSYERGMYRKKGVVPDNGTVHGGAVLPGTVTYEQGIPLEPAAG